MMLEGKELIIATKAFAEEDRTKSWVYTLSTFVFLVSAFVGAVSPLHIALRIVCSLLTGLLLLRLFTIYHDYLHHTILKGSLAARILFTFFGLYTLNPPSIWKRSHDHHHKHNSNLNTSSIGSFPIITKAKFRSLSRQAQFQYLFVRHPLTIAAGYLFAFLWGMCVLSLTRNPSKHWDSGVALAMHLLIGVTLVLTLGWTAFLLGFLLPAIFSSAMGSYLFYAQHNFPTATFADKQSWTYIGAALQSSSYMKMGPIMHWFTGNIGYHQVHHTNARIPFYRLPEAYAAFPAFHTDKTTSLHPRDVWACLQMKAWDPVAHKMVTLEELRA